MTEIQYFISLCQRWHATLSTESEEQPRAFDGIMDGGKKKKKEAGDVRRIWTENWLSNLSN